MQKNAPQARFFDENILPQAKIMAAPAAHFASAERPGLWACISKNLNEFYYIYTHALRCDFV